MRYNKQELCALASQSSQNFDREGVLVLKERQDGFFRRSEGCSVRWFRLRGNLLFYLKGPEPWYEPMGVIVLGQHQVKLQSQDENGHWPFHIVWDNGVCYRMATFHESERTMWEQAIQVATYTFMRSQMNTLKEGLNKIRPIIDIASYRMQKGIVTDMNEVPLCELALSCDNLLCDAHGRPPSPMIVVFVKYPKGLSVKYGATEIFDTCSNPSFSKTILFRASDGLTGDSHVNLVVYDVRERVSETCIPMGHTSLQLSTIQEAQRLRVALLTRDNKQVGFVTINGWSLEPAHSGEKACAETQLKLLCHRRSQSLPPRLGLKLKFPSYGSLFKQNFVNCHQVTYRFHSGLGGDIKVHEIMAEPKLCYQMPMQLLDIYIQHEKELLEELLSVGELGGAWRARQLELIALHVSVLKLYCHAKLCMEQADSASFKPSSRKDEAGLEFAPVNLHLQRMWVHNDTLNKTGFHDVVTAGAFAAHSHKAERTGGLIRLVQQAKDVNSSKAEMNSAANKIQAEYDNVLGVVRLRHELEREVERVLMLLQARRGCDVLRAAEGINAKVKSMMSLWDPGVVEEALSYIGWPKNRSFEEDQSGTTALLAQLSQLPGAPHALCAESDARSSGSSQEPSPTAEAPAPAARLRSAEPTELQFHPSHFVIESAPRGSFSLDNVSCRGLMDSLGSGKRKDSVTELPPPPGSEPPDPAQRAASLELFKGVASAVEETAAALLEALEPHLDLQRAVVSDAQLAGIRLRADAFSARVQDAARWLRVAHAALRLRCEAPRRARDHAALQTRRDACFSQALATATAGLVAWLCAAPGDVVWRLLSSGLGPLCAFEGLLSLYSAEKAMWGDMVVAVEDLQTVVFTLVQVGHSNSAIPQVTGTRGSIVVQIPVTDSLYNMFTQKEHLSFTITAVLFNIGINEKATLAEALGETTPQHQSNGDNLDRLTKYWHKYTKIFPPDHAAARAPSRPLEEVMAHLRAAVLARAPRGADVLRWAALAARLMRGVRYTACKSGKDRTGMAVTLEQARALHARYQLAAPDAERARDIMRSEGCRRENTLKNIGVRKYAFSKKQVAALPPQYRPPPGAYGSAHS